MRHKTFGRNLGRKLGLSHFVLVFLLTFAVFCPRVAVAQGLMQIKVNADDYNSLVTGPMVVRGAAVSVAFSDTFKYLQQGDYAQALEEIERIIRQAQDSKDKLGEGVAWDVKGLIFQRQGMLDDAIQRHEQAILILQSQGEGAREAWANATNNLAAAYYFKGEYEQAARMLGQIVNDKDLSPTVRARALNNRGVVYQELGNIDAARTAFNNAFDDAEEDKTLRAQIRNNQARIRAKDAELSAQEKKSAQAQKYFDEALRRIGEARELAKDAKDKVLEANILDSWAEILVRANRPQEALQKLDEAEKLEKEVQAPLIRASITWNRGRALAMAGKIDEALAAYATVIKNTGGAKLPALYRESLASRANLYERTGKLNEAIADYEQAVDIGKTTRSRLSGQTEKDYIRATEDLYGNLVQALVKRSQAGDIEKALAYLDQSKSDALHRELSKITPELRDKDLQNRLKGAHGLLDQEATLTLQLQEALSKRTPSEDVEKLQKQLAEVRKNISAAYDEVKERYGERFGEYVSVSPLTFGQLKDQLPDGHLLVTFLPTDDALYFFLVSKESGVEFRQNQKIKRKDLNEKILEYREMMANVRGPRGNWRIDSWADRRWERLRKLTVDLYQALLQPISEPVTRAQHIIFAPTGLLYYLPIHALGEFDPKTQQVRFLVQDKAISYVTTATLLQVASGMSKIPDRSLFALGNPPFKQQVNNQELKRLPHAEEEVDAVGKLFGNRALILKDTDATREALLATFDPSKIAQRGGAVAKNESFGFVLLSTHGILDSRSPRESWLALDGTNKLFARDIPKLDLRNVSLVTLSACQTGLAEDNPGGELMNMATFFSQAGTPSIIVSLWSVDDVATRDLMVAFYQDILEQKTIDKSLALQQAQKLLASNPETLHPFFWAPFVLIGDWR